MTQITVENMKKHLLVASSFQDDDALITGYMQSAESLIEGYLRVDMATVYADGWPATALQAIRVMVAGMYGRRGFETDNADFDPLTPLVKSMLAHLRNLS